MQTTDWYIPFDYAADSDDILVNYENVVIWFISISQLIICMLAFVEGRPFKQPIYSNIYFTVALVVIEACNIFMTVKDTEWADNFLDLKNEPYAVPSSYRKFILWIVLIDFVATMAW